MTDKELARDPRRWSAEQVRGLQSVVDRSRATAGTAARETFDRSDRHMNATELVVFWNDTKVKAMATVSPKGHPHIAPVHASFENGVLVTTVYVDAVRRFDIRSNPEVALSTWGEGGAAVILYGRAAEIAGAEKVASPGASGAARRTIGLRIDVHRVYAMKARS